MIGITDVAAVAAMWIDGLNPHSRRAEDVAPVDRDAPELDLDALDAEWLVQCGPCDFGLVEMGCRCPSGDFRPPMSALVAEVRRLRARVADDDPLADERDWWRDHTRRLRHALTEVLGRIVEHTPGIGLCRSSWISAGTVARWREVAAAALDAAPPGQPVEVLEDTMCRRVWAAAYRSAATVITAAVESGHPGVARALRAAAWLLRDRADRIEAGELSPWEQEAPVDRSHSAADGSDRPDPHPDTPETSSGAEGLILGRALIDRDGDVWRETWPDRWRLPADDAVRTRAELEQHLSPVHEVLLVDPSAAAILDAAVQLRQAGSLRAAESAEEALVAAAAGGPARGRADAPEPAGASPGSAAQLLALLAERDRLTKEAEELRVALADTRATAEEWAGTADRATVRAVDAEHERDQAREAIGKLERHSARLAADLDQARAELAAVDEQLRQAGIEHPLGHHGVQDLRMRCEFHGELWELAGRLATLVASLVDTTSRPSQLRAVEVAELVADARRAGLLPDETEAGDGWADRRDHIEEASTDA